ncbi:MAG: hypothetical protein ABJG47_14765 [Ekhidna sp.]
MSTVKINPNKKENVKISMAGNEIESVSYSGFKIFVKIIAYNGAEYVPVTNTPVECIADKFLSNDILGNAKTNELGIAEFQFEFQYGSGTYDIFFLFKCGGRNFNGELTESGGFLHDLSTKDYNTIHNGPGYFENYFGELLSDIDNPLTFTPSLEVNLKLEIWSNLKQSYLPVAKEVNVSMVDYDIFITNPNDELKQSSTNENGRVSFKISDRWTLDEPDPDLFFFIKSGSKVLMIVDEQNSDNTEEIILEEGWSSEYWVSSDRLISGYLKAFNGVRLGTEDNPISFRLIPDETDVIDDFIDDSQEKILAWRDLKKIEFHKDVTLEKWNMIGSIQKKLFLIRLLKRYGVQPVHDNLLDIVNDFSDEFPNEFEGVDSFEFTENENIFMLEAVVEYFLNYNDPRKPILDHNQIQGSWKTTDLRKPIAEGVKARIFYSSKPDIPNSLGIDYVVGIEKAKAGDIMYLENAIDEANDAFNTKSKYFIIKKIVKYHNSDSRSVELHGNPKFLPGVESSRWKIIRTPNLVLIDSFGARNNSLKGESKSFSTDSPRILEIEDSAVLTKINNEFDTILIKSANGDKRYEIVEVDNSNGSKSVTVDRDIQLSNGAISSWHIPAGVTGQLPNLNYTLGPNDNRNAGKDHYDGQLFLIFDGKIISYYRWSSYTSRQRLYQRPAWASSMRGNDIFDYWSIRDDDSSYRNFCFRINDKDKKFKNKDGDSVYGVLNARFYFGIPSQITPDVRVIANNKNVIDDFVPEEADPRIPSDNNTTQANGKTGVIIHYGSTSGETTHSGGCVVSPEMFKMRSRLIQVYLDIGLYDNIYVHQSKLSLNSVGVLLNNKLNILKDKKTYTESRNLFNGGEMPKEYWGNLFKGLFYLIRPDEKPLHNYD